jgi:hypothetical protein
MRTHTGPRFIVLSEGRESRQPQVFRASHTNSKILVPDGAKKNGEKRGLSQGVYMC